MKRMNYPTNQLRFSSVRIFLLSLLACSLELGHPLQAAALSPRIPQDQGTVIFDEDFEDGDIASDLAGSGNYFLPPLDQFSNIVDAEGGKVFEINYQFDEFQRDISWIGEPFDSIEVRFRSRLPIGIPIGENSRPWVDLKQFRVFEDTGQLGDVFTTVIDKYDEAFENQGFEHWEIVHLYTPNVIAERITLEPPYERWIEFRYYMKWNSPGQSDGVLMIWHDDNLVFDNQQLEWFAADKQLRPTGLWIGGNYSGGAAGSPVVPVIRQFDDVFVKINGPIPGSSDNAAFQNGVLIVPGQSSETYTLNFEWAQRFAEFGNEFGYFIADEDNGTVDGIGPGQMDYAAASLNHPSRRIIFESGEGAGAETMVQVPGGSNIVLYMIQNATTSDFVNDNPSNETDQTPLAFFSIPNANPDNFDHLRESSTRENRWQLGWEDLLYGGDQSFMDAVINLELAIADAILGDINNDGTIDFLDIGPFVNLLLRGSYSANADFDRNGIVDFQDIAPFVNTLQRN